MNIREISKPVTAKSLNESLARRFGTKIKIESFTLEQLQDARNRIRTKLSQVETNESFDTVHKSESYQKSKLFLDVLNTAIAEREQIAESNDCDKTCPKSCPDCGGTGDPEKYKEMKEGKKPDADGDGVPDWADKKPGKDDNEGKKKGSKPKKGVVPPQFKKNVKEAEEGKMPSKAEVMKCCKEGMSKADCCKKFSDCDQTKLKEMYESCMNEMKTNESIVREGEEDKAELVMAAKDMVDRLTGWMEDTAEMQTESMLELADAIRDEMGVDQSDSFTQSVKPALESLYAAMEVTREALTNGVGQLTGEAPQPMGDDPEADMDMDMDMDMEEPEGSEDDFAAAEPAAGGEEEAGRAKRESVERKTKKKVAETSRRLARVLSKKK